MKKSQVCVCAVVVLIMLAIGSIIQAQEADLKNLSSQQKTRLSSYLQDLGYQFDCYFTLEEAGNSDEPANQFEEIYIQDFGVRYGPQTQVESLGASLDELKKAVPRFTFKVNDNNPRIIHIIDARLLSQENYPLNSILPSIKFNGTVGDLIVKIGKKQNLIRRTGSLGTGEAMFVDYITAVKLEAFSLPIRDALSNYIDLKDRSGRILWIARTDLGLNELTYIHYLKYPPPNVKK